MEWAVVTGAGSGIGRYLTLEFLRRGIPVLGVGRRVAALEGTAALVQSEALPATFRFVAADVSTAEGRSTTVSALRGATVRYLAHMAGAFPIKRLVDVSPDEWREAFAINVEARMFLTQALLPQLTRGARILFAKSGSSENPRIGCVQVCASTAASLMLQRCLRMELAPRGIHVTSAKPGFVKTEMMDATLRATPEVFPDIAKISATPMIAPDTCARYMAWLMMDTADAEFDRDGWSIEDASHHSKWLGGDSLHLG